MMYIKLDNGSSIIVGAAGAKNLKRNPPKHGFPVQKPCFGSVSEVFSTVKPCKIPQNFSASGRKPKKPPLFSDLEKQGGAFLVGGGFFGGNPLIGDILDPEIFKNLKIIKSSNPSKIFAIWS